MKRVYTVGHSNLEFQQLATLLEDAQVELLADVRSRPHSSRFPQFSQPGLEKLLEAEGIAYLFLGEELGGRPDDPDMYRANGVVDYRARRRSYAFRAGLERVVQELEARTVALMCAEEDPLECHRFLMICPELMRLGITPAHLRKGSRLESQEGAENRLLESRGFAGVTGNTLFPEARAEALEDAYALQAEKFAFRVDPPAVDARRLQFRTVRHRFTGNR
ncbi:MAG TPA: DUF488 domain-containing protein [Terriglobia bacterium]|nr:DUF488 domain-containing protein [Terriglobia bacterium]